jgi:pimeloyl-ACP methyl ester carboxylesterase
MRHLLAGVVASIALAVPSTAAAAPALDWADCGGGFQCATATVPQDYAHPDAGSFQLAVIKLPAKDAAHRIGSLFMNPGGPGGSGVAFLRGAAPAFTALNQRFDLVSWDPRGVGASRPAVVCLTDAENEARNAQPFIRPDTLDRPAWIDDAQRHAAACRERNPGVLPYITTGNVARDLDGLRAAVGDAKLTYLGYSYGTAIGATYASMFPDHQRALVLDGAVDPQTFFFDPITSGNVQTAGFEDALSRFLARCRAEQARCGFGGRSPRAALEALLSELDAKPIAGFDSRPVTGDVARLAIVIPMYVPDIWPVLADALSAAQQGDGSILEALADAANGRDLNGHYDPSGDQFYAIYAVDGAWPADVSVYAGEGRQAFEAFPHFFFNHGFSELQWGELRVPANGPATGPFRNPRSAPTTLVVGNTHDPATPLLDARALTAELGNARLLTMDGDGHTASYFDNGACIDDAVTAYFEDLTLPARGTVCDTIKDPFPPRLPGTRATKRAMSRALAGVVRFGG